MWLRRHNGWGEFNQDKKWGREDFTYFDCSSYTGHLIKLSGWLLISARVRVLPPSKDTDTEVLALSRSGGSHKYRLETIHQVDQNTLRGTKIYSPSAPMSHPIPFWNTLLACADGLPSSWSKLTRLIIGLAGLADR